MRDSGERSKGVRRGRLGRAARLSKLALGGGRRLLVDRVRGLAEGAVRTAGAEAFADDMVATLSEMKGVAMKLGQMLSYVDDLLPEEARRRLVALQRDAKPLEYGPIRDLFIEEQGEPPEARFEDFDESPFAAASIGQVHRARLPGGRAVAVKIQYPGIAEAMSADLENARMFGLLQRVFFFRTNREAIFREIEERLLDECDYRKEAEYQEAFRERLAGHPVIVIPEVHRQWSSRRVLTTTLYEGLGFDEWLATDPPDAARRRAMATFYRFYLGSLYLDGLFNCDPHPGNYLFLEDGRIVFLDHGCTRRFSDARRRAWIEMCRAVSANDAERIHEAARVVGFIPESVEDYDREAFERLMRYIWGAYLEDGPYDFSDHPPPTTFRQLFTENPNLFKMDMPADAVFLNRITFGLVSLMTALGSDINVYRLAHAYFEGRDPDWPDDPFLAGGAVPENEEPLSS